MEKEAANNAAKEPILIRVNSHVPTVTFTVTSVTPPPANNVMVTLSCNKANVLVAPQAPSMTYLENNIFIYVEQVPGYFRAI